MVIDGSVLCNGGFLPDMILLLTPCYLLPCVYGHTYSKSMDQPDKVVNPARGQLNRENEYSPVRVRA